MRFREVVFVLSCCFGLCLAKDKIRIGFFLNDAQNEVTYWDVIAENIEENVELIIEDENIPVTQRISDKDIFETTKEVCSYIDSIKEDTIIAIFGPKTLPISSVIESITSHLNIPYFTTSWRPRSEQLHQNVFNLYPDTDLLSTGLATIVKSFDWTGFTLLYEDDEGLLKLQEVLKLQQYDDENVRNDVFIQKLEIGGDNRHILKGIRSSVSNRIILDCHVDRIMDIFQQAQQVDLLSDFSRSFFLTSLDAHTLDFSSLKTQVNITTIRLFDPFSISFQRIASNYFPDILPSKIRVENALTLDGLLLITETINKIKVRNSADFEPRDLNCDNQEKYDDDLHLIEELQQIELTDTLTGPLSLQMGKRDKFVLEVIETDAPEKPIGIWNSENPEKIHLTRNATEREAELQKRLESYNFIVTSRIGPPYLYENKKPDAYKNQRYYGYSMDLITEVAKIMNISFEFKITEGNSYLNLVNDLVERRADLGICDFTITPQRREVIDFSMPFMNLGIGILHKGTTQEQIDNMYAFMRPISWTVWFYIWTLSLVSSLTMFFVARLAPGEWENPKPWDPESKEMENIWTFKNFLWLSLGSITAQGCDILPKAVPTRIISASWWIFSLIITSSYTANLAAFLTMQKRDVTIDNIEELATQSKVKYGLMAKGSTETFFSTSNNSLYQKMWNTMKNEKPGVFEKDNFAGVERVLSTKNALYAYFMESTGLEFEMARNCELRKIGGLLDSKSYGIGMPLNADYRHAINQAVLHLQESGKLMELKTKWWKENIEGEPCVRQIEEESDALALSNVGGIFIVLAVGIGLAYMIALIEFLWNVRQLSIEEHLSYLETLKCELKFACKIHLKKKRAKPLPSESSSSTQSSQDHDKLSIARSLFDKSASLLNFNTEQDVEVRSRQRSGSKASKYTDNHHLRVI